MDRLPSTTKVQPATPLPWFPRMNTDGQCLISAHNGNGGFAFPLEASYGADNGKEDVLFVAHACNAYPKLVEALRQIEKKWIGGDPEVLRSIATKLLFELGEE